MSTNKPTPIRLALHRTWWHVRDRWFEHTQKQTATGEEVRDLIRRWLDHQAEQNPMLVRYWDPLSPADKDAALLDAFPDRSYASGDEEERAAVIELLSDFKARFDEIVKLVGDRPSLAREDKEHAQMFLKGLKKDLDLYSKEAHSREDEMTKYERHYFYPAVEKAHAHIHVRWNTDPIKSNWVQALGSAAMEISYFLSQLKHAKSQGTD